MSTDDAIDLTQADDDSYEQLQQQLLLVEDQLQEVCSHITSVAALPHLVY
jgi:flagellar basal body-associated protein FliL